jgi:hypothetical protein
MDTPLPAWPFKKAFLSSSLVRVPSSGLRPTSTQYHSPSPTVCIATTFSNNAKVFSFGATHCPRVAVMRYTWKQKGFNAAHPSVLLSRSEQFSRSLSKLSVQLVNQTPVV